MFIFLVQEHGAQSVHFCRSSLLRFVLFYPILIWFLSEVFECSPGLKFALGSKKKCFSNALGYTLVVLEVL